MKSIKSTVTNRFVRTIIAATTLVLGSHAVADSVKVGFAPEPYPPFAVPDSSGNWSGWEIDIIHAVCEAAEITCELTPTAWDGLIPALKAGKIDLIMGAMSITDERKKVIDFSDKYYSSTGMLVSTKGLDVAPTAEGMKGKVAGLVVGSTHNKYVQAHFGDVVGSIKEYQTQDEANQDLVSGRIDVTVADTLAMDEFLKSETGKSCCQSNGTIPNDEVILGAGIGAGLRKGDDELMAKVNAAIEKIRPEPYNTISAKYFDFDIYGE